MSVSSSDCSMMPSISSPRASSAPSGAWSAGVCESSPYSPAERVAVPDRQVERRDAGPEGLLAGGRWWPRGRRGRGRSGPPPRPAACRPRRTPPTARRWPGRSRPRRPRRHLGGGDHEQRGVGGAQPGAQLADEVAVAGGVDQVDLDVRRAPAAPRPARPSAAGGSAAGSWSHTVLPSTDGAGPRDRGGVREQRLDQGRLPRPGRPDQDHVAHLGRIAGGEHRRPALRTRSGICSDGHGRPPPQHCVNARGTARAVVQGAAITLFSAAPPQGPVAAGCAGGAGPPAAG